MKLFVCIPVITGNGAKYTATNLAHYTKTLLPTKRVALVDFDFKYPYLAEKLSLHDTIHSIDNLTDKIDGGFLDSKLFLENMIKLKNGVDLLKGTKLSHSLNLIKKHHIEKIIELLKEEYDYVFVSATNEALSGTIYSMFNADKIILVAKNNYSNYKELKKVLKLVNNYKGQNTEIDFIINQCSDVSSVTFTSYFNENNIKNIELIPYDENTFDNSDLDKNAIAQKMFKSKNKVNEVFENIVDRIK